MKKNFEIGKRYCESGLTFEITGITEKTISYRVLQHAGLFNERVIDERKSKLQDWNNRYVFFYNSRTIDAACSPCLVDEDDGDEFVDDNLLDMYFN